MATVEAKERIELPDTPNIRRQYAYVKHMRERVALAEKALKEMVEAFQSLCEHDFEEIERPDNGEGFYEYSAGGLILIGWRCKKCFVFKPKGISRPKEICQKCGGIMKYIGIIRNQDRQAASYACENCGDIYSLRTL